MACVAFFRWIGKPVLQLSPEMCLPQRCDASRVIGEEIDQEYVPPERMSSHIASNYEASANDNASILSPIQTQRLLENRPLVNELHKQGIELDFYISDEIPTDGVTLYNVKCQITRYMAKKPTEHRQSEFINYRYSATELNTKYAGKELISYYREKKKRGLSKEEA
ncbi:hypothetical protein BDV35DRAFT_398915 [Aspergillus flavus]|uniref:Uncharacterized protein n=1 Tax=Aspergillus flavus TaxID=5059 RepID=A0A5N6GCL3_ASPFL|nr:hypothetical protein BDV35DRAFT_398915 [Aspergillus flavus]